MFSVRRGSCSKISITVEAMSSFCLPWYLRLFKTMKTITENVRPVGPGDDIVHPPSPLLFETYPREVLEKDGQNLRQREAGRRRRKKEEGGRRRREKERSVRTFTQLRVSYIQDLVWVPIYSLFFFSFLFSPSLPPPACLPHLQRRARPCNTLTGSICW